jgi:hypothetical protein
VRVGAGRDPAAWADVAGGEFAHGEGDEVGARRHRLLPLGQPRRAARRHCAGGAVGWVRGGRLGEGGRRWVGEALRKMWLRREICWRTLRTRQANVQAERVLEWHIRCVGVAWKTWAALLKG